MSRVNIIQMIEKKKESGAPYTFWGEKDNRNNKIEESVFDNCLTGTVAESSSNDHQSKNDSKSKEHSYDKHLEREQISLKDIEEDSDIPTNEKKNTDDLYDSDETDYFDSEDEYWDTLIHKNIENNTSACLHCLSYHLPRSVNDYKTCAYEEEYDKTQWCTQSVKMFAKENNFEIHDVYGDGNCLFRAVADQFFINGCPGHTEASLRKIAIQHLESDPSKYGVHASSLLSGETWEYYLQRMKKSGEWGDHIVLQALADVFLLNISIYNFVHSVTRHSKITREQSFSLTIKLNIDLGHVGESHYCSLRPMNWLAELPYKAQIFRMLVTNTEKTPEERKRIVNEKFEQIARGRFPESYLAESLQFVLQWYSLHKEQNGAHHINFKPIFITYNGRDLQQEETRESQKKLIGDQSYIDPVSGIPSHHLTFIIKHLFPIHMFRKKFIVNGPFFRIEDVCYHLLGSQADESLEKLLDLTRNRRRKFERSRVVVIKPDKMAIFPNEFVRHQLFPENQSLYVDSSKTHPGYCRLKISKDDTRYAGENIYQKAFMVPAGLSSLIEIPDQDEISCVGVLCLTFPFHRRWEEGRKRSDFPSRFLVRSISDIGCTLIPKSHPKSASQEIEWQFDFSMAEYLIFKSLTQSQLHCFFVVKLLLETMLQEFAFKTKHLKSVFLMACEEMPICVWETHFSGCVLYVLDSMLSCLKSRFLPNYFIPEDNLIDCQNEEYINTLCAIIEYIRLFPANTIQVAAEKYGYLFGSNLIRGVLSNAKEFAETKTIHETFYNLFGPLAIAAAKMFAKMGFYDVSLDILKERYEQTLLIPEVGLRQRSVSFSDLFMSALMEIKQKSSRVILSMLYDHEMGSSVSDAILKRKTSNLQAYLPWTVDKKIGWLAVPSAHIDDLPSIASFLYDYSKKEYWRKNVVLAELAITTAIRCIQETLKSETLFVDDISDFGLKAEVNAHNIMVKKKLIPFYVHLYSVSRIDFSIYPLINHMDDIEHLCNEFPEMTCLVRSMFQYTRQPEKKREYSRKMRVHFYGEDMTNIPESSTPLD